MTVVPLFMISQMAVLVTNVSLSFTSTYFIFMCWFYMRYVVYTVTPCNLVGGRNPEDRSINPHTLSEA
jgi:hypothetical protein